MITRARTPQSAERRRAARERGFTLIELIVAMVAGLIVALSVVALSREASNTFHEETRVASAEMQLRTAMDRLRADLQRAAFMSTGNIFIDPTILTTPGTATNVAGISLATYGSSTTAMDLYSLAGLRLWQNTSPAAMTLNAVNNVSPDAIDIAGNMTGVEILSVGPTPKGLGGGPAIQNNTGCNSTGQRIYLDVLSTPALWRTVGMSPTGTDATYGAQLVSAFQPVQGKSFIVRIVDNNTHKVQYAATCKTTNPTTQWTSSNAEPGSWNPQGASVPPTPYIDLQSNAITLNGTQPDATINPVQIVHWQVVPTVINAPGGTDSTKYDLTRQYVDATGALVGSPEVVAEYAVDLKFAFTVDNVASTTGDYSTQAGTPMIVNAFEDGSNGTIKNSVVAGDVQNSAVPYAGGVEPQRIRSVRVRLVTRSPLQDRSDPLTPAGPAAENDYLYRYCLVANATTCSSAGNPVFARTRTMITEVSLPNQAKLWFR